MTPPAIPRPRRAWPGARWWLLHLVLLHAIWLPPGAAVADEPWRYRIEHQMFGNIGWHQTSVRRDGDLVVVEHEAELAVTILGVTAFERQGQYREIWRGERLIAFDGLTEDDGEPAVVTARAVGSRLVVEGPAGRIEVPPSTVPSQPSLEHAIERHWFFDIETGALQAGRVAPLGAKTLDLGAGPVETRGYEVVGDLEQRVWFDQGGVFAKWLLWRQGAAITLIRE
jgi:hypothetical protein